MELDAIGRSTSGGPQGHKNLIRDRQCGDQGDGLRKDLIGIGLRDPADGIGRHNHLVAKIDSLNAESEDSEIHGDT